MEKKYSETVLTTVRLFIQPSEELPPSTQFVVLYFIAYMTRGVESDWITSQVIYGPIKTLLRVMGSGS